MRNLVIILRTFAILGLIMILVFSILYASGSVSLESFKILILCSSLLWFTTILLSNLLKKKH